MISPLIQAPFAHPPNTRSQKRAAPADDESEDCFFCCERPRTARFLPCRHALSCDACARTLLDQKGLDAQPCPLCRQIIAAVEALPSTAPAPFAAPPSEWPRRVRLVVAAPDGATATITKFADFPPKGVQGGPLAALRAAASAKCFPGDPTPVVIKFKDSAAAAAAAATAATAATAAAAAAGVGDCGWADADDDGDVELLAEMWAAEGRAAGRAVPLIPTLRVCRATGAAAAVIAAAKPPSSVDLPVGTVVVLALGYEAVADSLYGPMRPGDRGVIVASDGSDKPYNVALQPSVSGQASSAFWYKRAAVCLPGAANAAVRAPEVAPRTTPFAHPRHAHALTWQDASSVWTCDGCMTAHHHHALRMRCAECDFDLCTSCREKAEAATKRLIFPATADRTSLYVGDKVVRGPQWKWGGQDGGAGSVGTCHGRAASGDWVKVKWDGSGHANFYRYGADACDVKLADADGAGPAAETAVGAAPAAFVVGAAVVLARGFDGVADAARGCLVPGSRGTIVEIRAGVNLSVGFRGVTAFKVQCEGPKPWWYAHQALCLPGAPNASPADHAVGTEVVLRTGYGRVTDAAVGPLKPGDVGTVVECDGSATPYRVRAADGAEWWYRRRAVGLPSCADKAVVAEEGAAAAADAAGVGSGLATEADLRRLVQIVRQLRDVVRN